MPRFQPKYLIPPTMEGTEPRLGDGLSRPLPGEATRLYHLLVKKEGESPLRVTVRAATAAKAKTYATNRWPNSNVIVIK